MWIYLTLLVQHNVLCSQVNIIRYKVISYHSDLVSYHIYNNSDSQLSLFIIRLLVVFLSQSRGPFMNKRQQLVTAVQSVQKWVIFDSLLYYIISPNSKRSHAFLTPGLMFGCGAVGGISDGTPAWRQPPSSSSRGGIMLSRTGARRRAKPPRINALQWLSQSKY